MTDVIALDRLCALLDSDDETTTNTSMRLPVVLRDAAALAVDQFGIAASATTLTADALRQLLETVRMQAVLDAHAVAQPSGRPSLAEVALALAEQQGSALAGQPEAIARAAREVVAHRPDADAADVLLWATAQAAA